MNFELPPELQALQTAVREFIRRDIIPMEQDERQTEHGPGESLRLELTDKAHAAGLLAPQVSTALGGRALSHRERAVVFEEAGYSPLGPVAMNVFAPDEGNMHLLESVATVAQQAQWLAPLAAARIRSCFCMSEPPPGAGSDPRMLLTTATRQGDSYCINGRKWYITGAQGAAFAIIMARHDDNTATMFLADMTRPEIVIERLMDSLDRCFPGGHAVVRFDDLMIPASDVLGEVGKGFEYAQRRLAPARLTHCMRWLGAARRAHDVACDHARQRQAFGKPLGEHEGVGFKLADNEMDLHQVRLSIWHTAWLLDQGGLRLRESSQAKVIASEKTWQVVDRCVQILGGQGVTGETIVARIFRDMRAFQIYDGPSEVHRWSLARQIMRRNNG